MMKDWKLSGRDDQELKIMWKNASLARYFSIGCAFLNTASLVSHYISNLFEPIKFLMKKSGYNETEDWPLYFKGSFPYDTQVHPSYELTILGQVLSNLLASLSFDASDSFFCVLMFHLIGQLSILKLSLKNLVNKMDQNDNNNFEDKIMQIHSTHNRLWR